MTRLFVSLIRSSSVRQLGSILIGSLLATLIKFLFIIFFAKIWDNTEEYHFSIGMQKLFDTVYYVYFLIFAVYSALICTRLAVVEFYDKKLLYVYLIVFLFAALLMALMGVPALIRGGFILFCMVCVAMLTLVFLVLPRLNIYNLPKFQLTFKESFISTYENILFSAEILTFAKLLKYTVPYPKKKSVFTLLIINFCVSTVLILLVALAVGEYSNFVSSPTFALAQITNGFFLENVEALFFSVWVVLGVFRTAIMLNFSFEYFNKVIVINKGIKLLVFFLIGIVSGVMLNIISYTSLIIIKLCLFLLAVVIFPMIYYFLVVKKKKGRRKDV